eukprot:PhM_4_TR1143/c0_g2_i1/m.61801
MNGHHHNSQNSSSLHQFVGIGAHTTSDLTSPPDSNINTRENTRADLLERNEPIFGDSFCQCRDEDDIIAKNNNINGEHDDDDDDDDGERLSDIILSPAGEKPTLSHKDSSGNMLHVFVDPPPVSATDERRQSYLSNSNLGVHNKAMDGDPLANSGSGRPRRTSTFQLQSLSPADLSALLPQKIRRVSNGSSVSRRPSDPAAAATSNSPTMCSPDVRVSHQANNGSVTSSPHLQQSQQNRRFSGASSQSPNAGSGLGSGCGGGDVDSAVCDSRAPNCDEEQQQQQQQQPVLYENNNIINNNNNGS